MKLFFRSGSCCCLLHVIVTSFSRFSHRFRHIGIARISFFRLQFSNVMFSLHFLFFYFLSHALHARLGTYFPFKCNFHMDQHTQTERWLNGGTRMADVIRSSHFFAREMNTFQIIAYGSVSGATAETYFSLNCGVISFRFPSHLSSRPLTIVFFVSRVANRIWNGNTLMMFISHYVFLFRFNFSLS